MALRPAAHSIELYLDQLTPRQFLVMAYDIVGRLSWNLKFISDSGLIAKAGTTRQPATITIRIIDDHIDIRAESAQLFDFGRSKKLLDQFTGIFYEVRNTIDPEEMARKYEQLQPQLAAPESDILRTPAAPPGKSAGFFSLFLPQKGYFITPVIIDLNILVWLLMVCTGVDFFAPDTTSLLRWGANLRTLTVEGDWWRLITNTFLHIGIFHLLLNMYALIYVGFLLEPILGKTRFATAYLLTGIIASLTSIAWHNFTVSAGASGAIFGMYGVFLAMLTTNLIDPAKRNALLGSIAVFVAYNLFYGMKEGIDNAAHLGGLISGILIGYLYYPGLRSPDKIRLTWSAIILAAIVTVGGTWLALTRLPDDFGTYRDKMQDVAKIEQRALAVLRLPDDQRIAAIRDSGLYYWNKDLELLQEIKQLPLPETIQDKTDTLIRYCNLRVASYQWMCHPQGDASTTVDSASIYNAEIESIINGLKNN
jgi:rhomboid protease GluP